MTPPRRTRHLIGMGSAQRFTADYRESLVLADGTEVVVRLLGAADKQLLADGFARLSPVSRYHRFFGHKPSLSHEELRYLTEPDGLDHFALGAVMTPAGRVEGAGVARFVRLPDQPEVAEPAVTVADSLQGRGLGRLLLGRLIAAAAERRIRLVRGPRLEENMPMRALARSVPGAV